MEATKRELEPRTAVAFSVPLGQFTEAGEERALSAICVIELRHIADDKWKQTIDHKFVKDYYQLSIVGDIRVGWKEHVAYGQIADELRTLERRSVVEDFDAIMALWSRWHLNDMKAGCIHQVPINANDPNWSALAEANTMCCPRRYRYGSAWLCEPLPEAVVDQVLALGDKYHMRRADTSQGF